MADTIITNSNPNPNPNNNDSAAGWLVAFVIIIAVILGGVILYRRGAFNRPAPAPAPASSTNINVTLPPPPPPTTSAGATVQY